MCSPIGSVNSLISFSTFLSVSGITTKPCRTDDLPGLHALDGNKGQGDKKWVVPGRGTGGPVNQAFSP